MVEMELLSTTKAHYSNVSLYCQDQVCAASVGSPRSPSVNDVDEDDMRHLHNPRRSMLSLSGGANPSVDSANVIKFAVTKAVFRSKPAGILDSSTPSRDFLHSRCFFLLSTLPELVANTASKSNSDGEKVCAKRFTFAANTLEFGHRQARKISLTQTQKEMFSRNPLELKFYHAHHKTTKQILFGVSSVSLSSLLEFPYSVEGRVSIVSPKSLEEIGTCGVVAQLASRSSAFQSKVDAYRRATNNVDRYIPYLRQSNSPANNTFVLPHVVPHIYSPGEGTTGGKGSRAATGSSATKSAKQHTFVETESVRYVYQPIDQLYMLLITTKASNILEDLETLRLFSRVIPEYCRAMDEKDVLDNAFNLIFAFDEVVALGYRENVNLAQIRTFTEMESHEEKVYLEMKKSQEREARDKAKEKARELAALRKEASKRGVQRPPGIGGGMSGAGGIGGGNMGGFGSDSSRSEAITASTYEKKPSYQPSKPAGPTKAMRLGGKQRDVEQFVDQLKSEGQDVVSGAAKAGQASTAAARTSSVGGAPVEPCHLKTTEKISVQISRNGGLENLEVNGMVTALISKDEVQQIRIPIENADKRGAQLQTHPNLDKKAFLQESVLTLKNPQKPFPLNTEVGILKWRFQTQDDSHVPLSINCWPSETGGRGGGADVNIEYTLEDESLTLTDVVIHIPLPLGASPVVGDCDGEYKHERGKSQMLWILPVIDADNKSGAMEFSVPTGAADDFFPVTVDFVSEQRFCDIRLGAVTHAQTGAPVKVSQTVQLTADNYTIV